MPLTGIDKMPPASEFFQDPPRPHHWLWAAHRASVIVARIDVAVAASTYCLPGTGVIAHGGDSTSAR